MRKIEKIQVICKFCRSNFLTHTWKIKQGKGKYCSRICYLKSKVGRKAWNKGKKMPKIAGSNSPHWKGGISSQNHLIRTSAEYRNLIREIIKRDNYQCKLCGQIGGKLHVDHRLPFSLFSKERLNPKNLNTLCITCHKAKTRYDYKFIKRVWPIELLLDVIYPERVIKNEFQSKVIKRLEEVMPV